MCRLQYVNLLLKKLSEASGIVVRFQRNTHLSLPFAKKKMKGKMNEYIIEPYKKVIECAVPEAKRSPY